MSKILITGSSSGIGQAIASCLLENGSAVVGLARNHDKFKPNSTHYFPYTIDFADIARLRPQFLAIQKQHPDIAAVICCAGYGHFAEIEQFSVQHMLNLMNVNFLSQAILLKTLLPMLRKQQQAKIIFMGSECALQGQKKGAMYCAAKFALRGFSQSIRKELASANVAVTLINPGMVDTPFFAELNFKPGDDISNCITPQQITAAILMLLNTDNNCVIEEINLQPMKRVIVRK